MNGSSPQRQRHPSLLLQRLNHVNVMILGVFLGCVVIRFSSFAVIDLVSVNTLIVSPRDENDLPTTILVDETKTFAVDDAKKNDGVERQAQVEVVTTEVAIARKPSDTSPSSCFHLNSREWLEGPRVGNIREGMTAELVKSMILDIPNMLLAPAGDEASKSPAFRQSLAQRLLGHSMCLKESRFLTDDAVDPMDSRNVRLWATRLVFLAFHYHQHRLAIPEAKLRLLKESSPPACSSEESLQQHDIGSFDFQCPDAKYLVMTLAGVGIGANIRGGAAVALMAGLATDRVVLFVNNAPTGETKGKMWELASCPRRDHQCFFMPTSPCTLTHKDLEDAYYMSKHESRQLWKTGRLPAEHENDKVIHTISLFQPLIRIKEPTMLKLAHYARELVAIVIKQDTVGATKYLARYGPVLKAAIDAIMEEDPPRVGYNFAAANQKIAHSVSFYAMRPNPTSQKQLAEILREIIPADINAEETIGLPIRASDKCFKESECLNFDDHMRATSDLWEKHLNHLKNTTTTMSLDQLPHNPSIIFTTEAKDVLTAQQAFSANETRQAQYPHRYNFVTNTKDIMPGTGKLTGGHSSGDDAMLSSMSSLQAQMIARVSIGNCCSNFHALLSDYMIEGCGAASDSTFLCLQEHQDPLLRVCCGWHLECKEFKKKLLANMTTHA